MISRLEWIIRSYKLRNSISHFRAHWSSYANKKSSFQGYTNIGKRCQIIDSSLGRFTYVTADTKIIRSSIGSFCSIGQECLIGGLASHPLNWISTHPAFYSSRKQANFSFVTSDELIEQGRVNIGHDVWIGARAIIIDGCNIGNGAVIAAGAVVVKDVPPYAIVGGVPAKVIKFRFPPEKIEKIRSSRWWELDIDELAKINMKPESLD